MLHAHFTTNRITYADVPIIIANYTHIFMQHSTLWGRHFVACDGCQLDTAHHTNDDDRAIRKCSRLENYPLQRRRQRNGRRFCECQSCDDDDDSCCCCFSPNAVCFSKTLRHFTHFQKDTDRQKKIVHEKMCTERRRQTR